MPTLPEAYPAASRPVILAIAQVETVNMGPIVVEAVPCDREDITRGHQHLFQPKHLLKTARVP